ncbi:DUF6602 domain-containing protein [Microbacterium sp. NPDC089695]|uniref:DUF6602 domain-containing protein n=1 Tax=Microbacterium sp. NPDC089695 TaxID=3364198 RepID=UPI003804E345
MVESFPDAEVAARLSASFAAQEARLQATLAAARAEMEHRGLRGDAVERGVREFLSKHMPRRYTVGTGEIIDRFGHRSAQTDVLLLTDEQPFVNEADTSGQYLVEGVGAAGEVKTVLNSSELDDILDKGAKLRQIRPTLSKGAEVQALPSDMPRFVDSLPFFALAMESRLKPETLLQKLNDAEEVLNWNGSRVPKLDALFVVDGGVYYNFGDGRGAQRFMYSDGSNGVGWIGPFTDGALVSVFIWLNATIPRVRHASTIVTPYLTPTNLRSFPGADTSAR